MLRASLTSGSVLSKVFGKDVNNWDSYVLPSLKAILSYIDNISNTSFEILKSIERNKLRFKELASLEDSHH